MARSGWPTASPSFQPVSDSATGLRYSTRPARSLVTTASPIDASVTWARSFSANSVVRLSCSELSRPSMLCAMLLKAVMLARTSGGPSTLMRSAWSPLPKRVAVCASVTSGRSALLAIASVTLKSRPKPNRIIWKRCTDSSQSASRLGVGLSARKTRP